MAESVRYFPDRHTPTQRGVLVYPITGDTGDSTAAAVLGIVQAQPGPATMVLNHKQVRELADYLLAIVAEEGHDA